MNMYLILVQQTRLIGYLRSTFWLIWFLLVCFCPSSCYITFQTSSIIGSSYCSNKNIVLLFVYRHIVLDRSEFLTSPYIAHCVLYYWILFFVYLKSASSSTSSHLIRRCHRFYVVILFPLIGFSVWTLFVFISEFSTFPVLHCLRFSTSLVRIIATIFCPHHRFIVVIAFPSSSLQLLNIHPSVSARCIQSSTRSLLEEVASSCSSGWSRYPLLASPSLRDTVVSSPGAVSRFTFIHIFTCYCLRAYYSTVAANRCSTSTHLLL